MTASSLAPIAPPMHPCFSTPAYLRVANSRQLADTGGPTSTSPRPAARLAIPSDEQNPVHTEGRAVDGRLARPDADRDGRRPRNPARAERVSGHGGALDRRLADIARHDPQPGRLRGDANVAAAAAYRAQPRSLCRADRLVLLADADSAGPGGLDRIHHAD